MLNGRLYRAAFAPFLLALAIAAFSLQSRPAPLTSTLAPEAFEGAPAFAELKELAGRYPQRRPGSRGDEELADHVAQTLRALGGSAGGGFSVHTLQFDAQTIDGERALSTIIAERPGSTNATPILIVAHRDAAGNGAAAELSGTAALLELARVFASRETKRTIMLASTSGSGGAAGAAQLEAEASQLGAAPLDAAIVLGDLAGTHARAPFVVPYSEGVGQAPLQLQRTVAEAISQELGKNPGAPSTLGQLAHLAFPLTVGEQGVLNAEGVPAVLVQVSGERGPSSAAAVSEERLEGLGRAVLSSVDALDGAPDIAHGMQSGLLLTHKLLPAWALRLLVLTLLLPPLVAAADGAARLRRRRMPLGRWVGWVFSCALPFLICAVFAYMLGWLGVFSAVPATPVLPSALPFDARAVTAVVAVALTFALSWLLWAALVRRLGWGVRPVPEAAGLAAVLALFAVALLAWVGNPLTALLALPALHAWLLLAAPNRSKSGWRPRRWVSLALVVLGLAPLALLVAFYGDQLGLGAGDVAWMGVLLLAGGQVGLGSAVLWSVAFGCAAGVLVLALGERAPLIGEPAVEGMRFTIRGPLSYAGPGSLGGTESALRR